MDSFKKFASDAVSDALTNNNSEQKQNESSNNNSNNTNVAAAATGLLGQLDGVLSNANKENKEGNDPGNVANTLLSKLDGALGGGQKAEQKEGIDLIQEHVFKAGSQTNESAVEQAKDKVIADAVRSGYKSVTGKDIPF
ncbi:hypothetical protein CVT24_011736 [Panaeolus cyanescens]|uniref:Uncharacterized protein n=1 Tax=Panaeolus cyanescens TaxID=181874 RepID=A0A409YNI8_9AGAR|nr:hypothetical protein CVT24_011736 [Panaeolus cyanescens]